MAEFIIPSIQEELAEARKIATEGVLIEGMNLMNALHDDQDIADLDLEEFVALMFYRMAKAKDRSEKTDALAKTSVL